MSGHFFLIQLIQLTTCELWSYDIIISSLTASDPVTWKLELATNTMFQTCRYSCRASALCSQLKTELLTK